MALLIWNTTMRYFSEGDEVAFFTWLQAIPGVTEVRGIGTELHIRFRSKRISAKALRELIAIYKRYGGRLSDLAQFENSSNTYWFKDPKAFWYKGVFLQ